MHILLTNDDGYFSIGLKALVNEAVRRGHEVSVIAPFTEQSGMSHRLTIRDKLKVRKVDIEGADAYALEGSPVDCVRVSRRLLSKKVDACISGINNGRNAGSSIYYSGTDGAAREATMLYLPSIAVSIDYGASEDMYDNIAKYAFDMLDYIIENPLPRLTFCNINSPALKKEDIKGVRMTDICPSFYKDKYEKHTGDDGDVYFTIAKKSEMEPFHENADNHLLNEGYITVTLVGGFSTHNHHFPNFKYHFE